MNYFALIVFLCISTIAHGQTRVKPIRKTTIDVTTVDHIKIGKHLKKPIYVVDSCSTMLYKDIKDDQISYIVDQWNSSEYVGEKKLKPKYSLEFYFKDGTKKIININNGLNEISRYWFQPKDNKYFDKLWNNTKD